MKCSEQMAWLSLWADGELNTVEIGELAAHLESCPSCRERWQAMQQVTAILRRTPLAQPDLGFTNRVMARIAVAQRAEVIVAIRHPIWVAALAGLVAISSLLVLSLLVGLGLAWSLQDLIPTLVSILAQTLTSLANWLLLLGAMLKGFIVAWSAIPTPASQAIIYSFFLAALSKLTLLTSNCFSIFWINSFVPKYN